MSPRVLIIDDDPVIVRLLEVNFRLEGFEVGTAKGADAVDAAIAVPPDAILLDVMMPGVDGYEVCRRLREVEALAGIPVMFLSARAADDDRSRGYALGVVDYITKPFDPGELVETVRRHIEEAGP